LAGGGSAVEISSLSLFGENFGIAYQLKDDLADLKPTGTSISRDIKKGRVTLPLIHVYNASKSKEKQRLKIYLEEALQNQKAFDNTVAREIWESLIATGAFDYVKQKIRYYIHQAIKSVKPLKDTVYKEYLVQMANSLGV
jgi:geranylgeranyl pyrophosphate synthase